jgi:glutamyl-tRNA synthetase
VAIRLICTCGHELRVNNNKAGERVPCESCGRQVPVPRRKKKKSASGGMPLWVWFTGGAAALALLVGGIVAVVLVSGPAADPVAKGKEKPEKKPAPEDPKLKPAPPDDSKKKDPPEQKEKKPTLPTKMQPALGRQFSLSWDAPIAISKDGTHLAVSKRTSQGRPIETIAWGPREPVYLSVPRGASQDWLVMILDMAKTDTKPYSFLFVNNLRNLSIAADGSRLLAGALPYSTVLWQPNEKKRSHTLAVQGSASAFSPDLKFALLGGLDGTMGLWDLAEMRELYFLKDLPAFACLTYAPDGRHALSGHFDKSIRLWDLAQRKELRRLDPNQSIPKSLLFSPDGQLALSADSAVRVWDVQTGKLLRSFTGHQGEPTCLALSPGGRFVLSGGKDGLRLWTLAQARELCRLTDTLTETVAFADAGRSVIAVVAQVGDRKLPKGQRRLAPSPTGAQHVGNARTYLIAWLSARSQGGRVLLRMEDIDSPRVKAGAADQACADFTWLGLDWDEGPIVQSQRLPLYQAALEELKKQELVYPCTCSRSDVERAASAPHGESPAFADIAYPGTCCGRTVQDSASLGNRPFAWRIRVGDESVSFQDGFDGPITLKPRELGGDFVVWKSAGTPAYQLAVVVDDADMGVTEVIRGDDLVASTPRQLLLYQALGLTAPAFTHVPLVVGADGRRLAKRHGDTRLATLRAAGVRPEALIGLLAWSCGWLERIEPISVRELLPKFRLQAIPKQPFVLTAGLLQQLVL